MGLFINSGAAIVFAGKNANSAVINSANVESHIERRSGFVMAQTRKDWSGAYSGLNYSRRKLLEEATGKLVGIDLIGEDPTPYGARTAEFMVDMLFDSANKDMKTLEELKQQDKDF